MIIQQVNLILKNMAKLIEVLLEWVEEDTAVQSVQDK
jgi:hypothetical protein